MAPRRRSDGPLIDLITMFRELPLWVALVMAPAFVLVLAVIVPGVIRPSVGPPADVGSSVAWMLISQASPVAGWLLGAGSLLFGVIGAAERRQGARPPTTGGAPPARTPGAGTRRCPGCGSPMVLRTARKGRGAGSRFWGCTTYPACRRTLRA